MWVSRKPLANSDQVGQIGALVFEVVMSFVRICKVLKIKKKKCSLLNEKLKLHTWEIMYIPTLFIYKDRLTKLDHIQVQKVNYSVGIQLRIRQ